MVYTKKECMTRRKFCQRLAGIAATGAFIGLQAKATANPKHGTIDAAGNGLREVAESGAELVAVCGLYCGACPMYLATHHNDEQKRKELLEQFSSGQMKMKPEDLECDGCLSTERVAVFCRKCEIRSCPSNKSDVMHCSDCSDFACSRITDFNNDGMLHHAEVLDNLSNIRKVGIENWTKYEEERWQCPECRESISWYDKACSNCGAKRSERLFPLKQGG